MTTPILIAAIAVLGLGFLLVIFKLIKKGGKIAAKLPVNFLVTALLYAVLGLMGFMLERGGHYTNFPVLMGTIVLLASLIIGIYFAQKLYEEWEWSTAAKFPKKIAYLSGIMLTGLLCFIIVFLLCESRDFPTGQHLKTALAWWLAMPIIGMLLPATLKHAHELWNNIPIISPFRQVFELPIGSSPPVIQLGRTAKVGFDFIIPLDYESDNILSSTVEIPLDKTLAEAFHYKLNDHNIVKRSVKKIALAEGNKRDKLYGWLFYRPEKIWWGLFIRKRYVNPHDSIGGRISNGDKIFVERVKTWEE